MVKLIDFSHVEKNLTQRTPIKDLNPVCHMPYELTICERFYYFFYETAEKNLQQTPEPEKRYHLKSS